MQFYGFWYNHTVMQPSPLILENFLFLETPHLNPCQPLIYFLSQLTALFEFSLTPYKPPNLALYVYMCVAGCSKLETKELNKLLSYIYLIHIINTVIFTHLFLHHSTINY